MDKFFGDDNLKNGSDDSEFITTDEGDITSEKFSNYTDTPLQFDPDNFIRLVETKDYSAACARILEFLHFLRMNGYANLTEEKKALVNIIAKIIIVSISNKDFIIPDNIIMYFIEHNDLIAKLASLSDYKTTDLMLDEVIKYGGLLKILVLYSVSNELDINVHELFAKQPYLASMWLSINLCDRWVFTEKADRKLKNLVSDPQIIKNFFISDKVFPTTELQSFCHFHATYVSESDDRLLKKRINDLIKIDFADVKKESANPDFKKVLVISRHMSVGHAVHKSISPLLYSLKGKYHLTLLHLYIHEENSDDKLFDEVLTIAPDPLTGSFSKEMLYDILNGNYGIVIFPDIALNRPSLILANLRIAPIQITTYGHPVSTFGAEIDYFIGGAAVEDLSKAEENYSERLIVIPGLGAAPVYPDYNRKKIKHNLDSVLISCSWGALKINNSIIKTLQKIIKQSERKVIFNFIGIEDRSLIKISIENQLKNMLGENVIVTENRAYEQYMAEIEKSDMAIDSYHFGSYNRIVDTLLCGKPIVTLKGKKAYNRLASALLESAGLPELIAHSEEEYIEKTVRLINDEVYRNELSQKILKINIREKIFNTGCERYFKNAVDYLVENHEKLKADKSRKPIVIEEKD